jgi:hypothetical protein
LVNLFWKRFEQFKNCFNETSVVEEDLVYGKNNSKLIITDAPLKNATSLRNSLIFRFQQNIICCHVCRFHNFCFAFSRHNLHGVSLKFGFFWPLSTISIGKILFLRGLIVGWLHGDVFVTNCAMRHRYLFFLLATNFLVKLIIHLNDQNSDGLDDMSNCEAHVAT